VWNLFNDAQRAALIDHELCHFRKNKETGAYDARGHDLEEFNEIVERHGIWDLTVRDFLLAGNQRKLVFDDKAAEAAQQPPEQPPAPDELPKAARTGAAPKGAEKPATPGNGKGKGKVHNIADVRGAKGKKDGSTKKGKQPPASA
jgi:hypothetical protein